MPDFALRYYERSDPSLAGPGLLIHDVWVQRQSTSKSGVVLVMYTTVPTALAQVFFFYFVTSRNSRTRIHFFNCAIWVRGCCCRISCCVLYFLQVVKVALRTYGGQATSIEVAAARQVQSKQNSVSRDELPPKHHPRFDHNLCVDIHRHESSGCKSHLTTNRCEDSDCNSDCDSDGILRP